MRTDRDPETNIHIRVNLVSTNRSAECLDRASTACRPCLALRASGSCRRAVGCGCPHHRCFSQAVRRLYCVRQPDITRPLQLPTINQSEKIRRGDVTCIQNTLFNCRNHRWRWQPTTSNNRCFCFGDVHNTSCCSSSAFASVRLLRVALP